MILWPSERSLKHAAALEPIDDQHRPSRVPSEQDDAPQALREALSHRELHHRQP